MSVSNHNFHFYTWQLKHYSAISILLISLQKEEPSQAEVGM